MKKHIRAWAVPGLAGLLAVGTAQAHPGHEALSLVSGLVHPLAGLDHLLAMVAVGLWSAAALPAGRRLAGQAVFLALLPAGAVLPLLGLQWGGLEAAVALSVTVLGLLMLAAGRAAPRLPVRAGLALVGVAALLHGMAHGTELQSGHAFTGYALGFMATSALLHAAGLVLGGWLHAGRAWAWRAAAAGMGLGGLALLASRL